MNLSLRRMAMHPILVPLALWLAAFTVMGMVYYFQFGMGLAPCPLCYWQRYPYYAAMIALPLILFLNATSGRATPASRILLSLIGAGFIVGATIAFYHVGVEQHWWPGLAACGGAGVAAGEAETLDRLLARPVVRCDEIPWSFLGVSMAGYNVLVSLGLAALALYAAKGGGGAQR